MEFIRPDINLNFVGRRKIAYVVSASLILMSIIALIVRGGPNYGVDFAGGVLIQIKFQKATTPQDIRKGLSGVNLGQSTIQSFGEQGSNEFLIRVQQQEDVDPSGISESIQASLEKEYGKGEAEIRRVEMVGPKVGKDLRQKALFAILYAILFILIYISGRFEGKWPMSIAVAGAMMAAVYVVSLIGAGITWLILAALVITLVVCFIFQLKYALGAIVALIHDVTITIGIFALLNKEMTLTIVAAILTIIGYSLNDTIIVFDRIRENIRKSRKEEFGGVINHSINETLSRTVLTSGTTLIVVAALFILGGPVIHDFALAMLIGIGVGTYSSIFVASPVLLVWPPTGGKRLKTGKA